MAFLSTVLLLAYTLVPGPLGGEPGDTQDSNQPISVAQTDQDKSTTEHTVYKTLNLQFPSLDQPRLVVIDITRGFVEVTGHDQPGVIIEVLNPPQARNADQKSGLKTLFAPKFDLDVDQSKNSIELDTYNQNYVLNLRVKVPRKCNLSLDSYYDGYLKVTDVSGTIDTHSEHGDITLNEIAGSATAFSRNGLITANFLDIADDANLDFESYNGSIYLTLPDGIQATTGVKTGRGSYSTMFDIRPIADIKGLDSRTSELIELAGRSGYQTGAINGGGIPIRIETEKGDIQIRKGSTENSKRPLKINWK